MKSRIRTPEFIIVAAALRLSAAVSRLTDVALVVHAFTVQEALQQRSRKISSTSQVLHEKNKNKSKSENGTKLIKS